MLGCGYGCTSSFVSLYFASTFTLLKQRIIRGSVTARKREVFFVVPSSLPKNSSQRISCIHREGLMVHVPAQKLLMFAYGVSSSSPTALQRYGTYRNDWKLEPAIQKVRGVNTSSGLNMKLSRCLIFWSTQEITLIVATRGAISLNLPDRNIQFLL